MVGWTDRQTDRFKKEWIERGKDGWKEECFFKRMDGEWMERKGYIQAVIIFGNNLKIFFQLRCLTKINFLFS